VKRPEEQHVIHLRRPELSYGTGHGQGKSYLRPIMLAHELPEHDHYIIVYTEAQVLQEWAAWEEDGDRKCEECWALLPSYLAQKGGGDGSRTDAGAEEVPPTL
jgi:hypothetical protein